MTSPRFRRDAVRYYNTEDGLRLIENGVYGFIVLLNTERTRGNLGQSQRFYILSGADTPGDAFPGSRVDRGPGGAARVALVERPSALARDPDPAVRWTPRPAGVCRPHQPAACPGPDGGDPVSPPGPAGAAAPVSRRPGRGPSPRPPQTRSRMTEERLQAEFAVGTRHQMGAALMAQEPAQAAFLAAAQFRVPDAQIPGENEQLGEGDRLEIIRRRRAVQVDEQIPGAQQRPGIQGRGVGLSARKMRASAESRACRRRLASKVAMDTGRGRCAVPGRW